jgi:primosomal protein N'
MAIRLARLERVALIASSHQRTINSRPAASRGKKRLDLSARIAWLGAY